MELLLYFIICLLATGVGAIAGIGGGVIIKPVLDLFSPMSVASISFLSGCTVLCMAVVSLLRSRGSGPKVELKRGTLLAVGAALGGILGKGIFDTALRLIQNDSLVGTVQNSILALLTAGVCLYVLFKQKIKTRDLKNPLSCILVGVLLGALGAFLGIGGGPINLVVLFYFFSLDTKTSALTSIYIILFSQSASLLSASFTGGIPTVNPWVLGVMAAGGILGGVLGRLASAKMSDKSVDRLFMATLVLITCISLYNVWHFSFI